MHDDEQMRSLRSQVIHYLSYKHLPFDQLDREKSPIYVIDYQWRYIYANPSALHRLGDIKVLNKTASEVWKEHPEKNFKPIYDLLREPVRKKVHVEFKSRSPIDQKTVEIIGHPLQDCYFFAVIELPDKDELLKELKTVMSKTKET